MPELRLVPIDSRHRKNSWRFHFEGLGATLYSGDQPVAHFPHEMAESRIILPSFWQSIEHLGIIDNNGTIVWFALQKESLSKIKAYLSWTLAIQGKEPIERLQKEAKSSLYWGTALLGVGLVAVAIQVLMHHGFQFDTCSIHLIWLPGLIGLGRAWTKRQMIKQIQRIQSSLENKVS